MPVLSGFRRRFQLLRCRVLLTLQVGLDEGLVSLVDRAHGGQHAQSDDSMFAELNALISHILADEPGKVDFLVDEHLALSIPFLEQNFDLGLLELGLLELGAILSEVEAAIFLELFVIERDLLSFSARMIGTRIESLRASDDLQLKLTWLTIVELAACTAQVEAERADLDLHLDLLLHQA